MTWKQFVHRFNEMMADTTCTPYGVSDLDAWHEQQRKTPSSTCGKSEKSTSW